MDFQLFLILQELSALCLAKSLKIVTAESCTAGGLSYVISSVPGSSKWFDRGFVTYSNNAKVAMLGVSEASITQFGAVSQEVAKEMAEGALRESQASLSLSVTGIAGPGGGSLEKQMGTCWFAWSSIYFNTHCKQKILAGNRASVRSQAIAFSLEELLKIIKDR